MTAINGRYRVATSVGITRDDVTPGGLTMRRIASADI
jgi:hypothetical protein